MSLLNITEMRRGCFFELGNFSPRKSHQVWKSAIVYIVQRLDLYLPYSRDTTRARTILERAYRCTRLKYRRLNFTKPIARTLCALLLANRRRQKLKLPKLCTPDRICIIVMPSFKYLFINPHSAQIKIHARYLSSCPILMVRVDLLRNNKAIILLLWNISTIIVWIVEIFIWEDFKRLRKL